MNKRVRIIDIAEKAGVSKGTVDRVIHNRGNVAPEVKLRVEKVMEELNYKRNIIASSLAYNKKWRIACLIPDPDNDIFWQYPANGIQLAMDSIQDFGFEIEYFFFPDADHMAFQRQAHRLVQGNFDAVLIAPLFAKEANDFFDICQAKSLPYVQINTLIEREEEEFLWYIGQDSYHSGVLAAKLLNFGLQAQEDIMILHLEKAVYNSRHLLEKEKGFQDYFNNSQHQGNVIIKSYDSPQDSEGLRSLILETLEKHPSIRGTFVTTSKLHYLVTALEPLGQSLDLKLLGFDLIPDNLQPLHNDKIDFLINQNPRQQGYLALMNLFNHLVLNKEFPKIQYLPLHIVMRENVQYYLESHEKLPVFI